MRLDPEHVEKMSRAISKDDDGDQVISIDIDFMVKALHRLSLWERGLLTQAIARSTKAKRLTVEQRVILALFVGGVDDEQHGA